VDAVETTGYPGAVERKSFALDGGSGTHVQAPAHYVVGGRTIDRFSLGELVDVPLVVVDCGAPYVDADYILTPEDVKQDERKHGPIPRGCFVAIRTGWGVHYQNRDRYYNVTDWTDIDESTGLARLHFPSVSEGAARLLRDRGVVGVGVDTMALDGPRVSGAARELLNRDCYVVANLHLPDELPARGAQMTVAPLLVQGAPEAPCRVYVRVP
jgi:kynurenine formamidase